MLLLEGVDCVGKTTVAMEMRRLLPGWSYQYFTKPPVEPFKYFGWRLNEAHPRIIVDRLHWSGYAYGKAWRDQPDLNEEQWRSLELILLTLDCQVLYMTDDVADIRARWRATQSKQMYTADRLETLLTHYDELVARVSTPKSVLNVVSHRLPELFPNGETSAATARGLARSLEDTAAQAARMLPASVGAGHWSAKFVMLGEEPRDQNDVRNDGPQVPLRGGLSCEWLWRAIDESGIKWQDGYYTNASAFQTPLRLGRYFSEIMTPRVIVCLGKKAGELAREASRLRYLSPHVQVRQVDHPSYARRFRSADFEGYCQELQDALADYQNVLKGADK